MTEYKVTIKAKIFGNATESYTHYLSAETEQEAIEETLAWMDYVNWTVTGEYESTVIDLDMSARYG